MGKGQDCETFSQVGTSGSGPGSITSGSESDLGSNGGKSQAESPEDWKTPEEQHESPYAQSAEAGIYPGATGLQQPFAFDFDFDYGVWVSTDPYAQLGINHPKELQPDWLVQGLGFPGSFT